MLKNIPFYASLLNRELSDKTKPTSGMVLVYGAIEAHSFGEKGCIASNKTIASETGLNERTVANLLSKLNSEKWVKSHMDDNNHRILIEPLLELVNPSLCSEPPFTVQLTPLHCAVNIDNSNKNTVIEKDTIVSLAKAKKTYGNQDINDLFEYWEEVIGYKIEANISKNRNACYNLIRKHGKEKIKTVIALVSNASNYRFSPRIADFRALQEKYDELKDWYKREGNSYAAAKF